MHSCFHTIVLVEGHQTGRDLFTTDVAGDGSLLTRSVLHVVVDGVGGPEPFATSRAEAGEHIWVPEINYYITK